MGRQTRRKDIRVRRQRREKRRRARLRELEQAVKRGRSRDDRVRIADEFWARIGSPD